MYDEGAFSAWITERLEHEAVCDRSPQPMLQGTPGQNQAARSIVYTIRSKLSSLRCPLADATITLFGSLFITAANTAHHIAALAPSPADNVQVCCTLGDVAIRVLHFAGQIENGGSHIRFATRVESTLDVPKLFGTYRGYMDDQSKRIWHQLANAGITTTIMDITADRSVGVYWFKNSTQLHSPRDLLKELLNHPQCGNFNSLETKKLKIEYGPVLMRDIDDNQICAYAHILRSDPTIAYKVKHLLSNVVLSQETDNPLTCRLQLCPIHPDERDPGSFPKQKEDIKDQMVHTQTRYTATFSFAGISFSDCNIDGIPLPILLMSNEHHKDKNVK